MVEQTSTAGIQLKIVVLICGNREAYCSVVFKQVIDSSSVAEEIQET